MSFTRGDDEAGGGGGASAIYGEIYAADDHSMSLRTASSTLSAAESDTPNQHTVTFSAAGVFNCVSLNTTASYLKIKVAGRYLVTTNVNYEKTATNTLAKTHMRIHVNGVLAGYEMTMDPVSTGFTAYQQTACQVIPLVLDLSVDDKISVAVTNLLEIADTVQFTVKASSSLEAVYLGETPA